MFRLSSSYSKYWTLSPWTAPAVPQRRFLPMEICPPVGIERAMMRSPGSVKAVYMMRLAQTPEMGRTSTNSALKISLASSRAISSTSSMYLHPA